MGLVRSLACEDDFQAPAALILHARAGSIGLHLDQLVYGFLCPIAQLRIAQRKVP